MSKIDVSKKGCKAYYVANILYKNEDNIETFQVCGLCKHIKNIDEEIPPADSLESISHISGKCSQAMTNDEKYRRLLEISSPEELKQKGSIGCFEPFENVKDIINSSDSEIFCFPCGLKFDLNDKKEECKAIIHAKNTHRRYDWVEFYNQFGNNIDQRRKEG